MALILTAGCIIPSVTEKAEAATVSITHHRDITLNDGLGKVGVFSDPQGFQPFCIEHFSPSITGTESYDMDLVTNATLAKVMYYGYGGPGQWSGFSSTDNAIACTSLLASYYYDDNSVKEQNYTSVPNFTAFKNYVDSKGTSESGTKVYVGVKAGYQDIARCAITEGHLTLKKTSSNTDITSGNSCYSLAGAVYNVMQGGSVVGTLTTNSSGNTNTIDLDPGNYTVKEVTASKGYALDTQTYNVTIRAGQTSTLNVKEIPQGDPIGAIVYKIDQELHETWNANNLPQGSASLEGAEYTVNYYDNYYDSVEDIDGVEPTRSWVIATDEYGYAQLSEEYLVSGDEFYYASDGETITVPLGSLSIVETTPSTGYNRDETVHLMQITSEGLSEFVETYQTPISPEPVKRGDLEFVKVGDSTLERLANVPFKITSKTTGESHIVVTDPNGEFSTSFATHSNNTNGNDAAYNEETGEVDESKLNYEYGVWFGQDTEDNKAPVSDEKGALPYDTYIIDELRCSANENMTLLKGIEIKVYRDGATVDLGTLTDDMVTIETTAVDSDIDDNTTLPREDITITDTAKIEGAEDGEEYTLIGTIMDKETGEELQIDGNTVTATTTFTSNGETDWVENEFNFDASGLAGKDIVVFEKLVKDDGAGQITIATHEDIDDPNQTIRFVNPQVDTTAIEHETSAHMGNADNSLTITDKVSYSGLLGQYEYEIKGTVVDAETGEPIKVNGQEVTKTEKVFLNKGNGETEMSFTFDATGLEGKTLVVFEEIYWDGMKVGEHCDLTDEDQSIHLPKVGTSAKDSETGTNISYADGKAIIVDTVTYENVIAGEEYKVTGSLIDKTTGKPIEGATGEAEFTAEDAKGTVEVTFELDASELAGKDIVVFETLVWDSHVVGVHNDLEDSEQTIEFPKIGTKAYVEGTDSNIAEPEKDIAIIDTVKYENIRVSDFVDSANNTKEFDGDLPFELAEDLPEDVKVAFMKSIENGNFDDFVLKGVLMDKETGKPFLADGEEVTAVGTFAIDKETGELQIKFPSIDASALAGKNIVVYETLYYKGTPVASHEDINDENQMISIAMPGDTPQTGQAMPYILIGLGAILAAAGIYVGVNRKHLFNK